MIGAYHNDGNGTKSGHVRIYQYSSGSWSQLGSDIDGEAEGDEFGLSVAMNDAGDRIAVGGHEMMAVHREPVMPGSILTMVQLGCN